MRPVRVYLDSSDFSVLSNPRGLNDELAALLRQLRRWVSDGQIICCFSGTHLSEMAPLNAAYSAAAQSRAGLLVDLCGRNTLISQNLLFAGELRFALHLSESLPEAHSPAGKWYPDDVAGISPIEKIGQIEIASGIQDAIQDMGMNRKARRIAERKAFKHGKPRAAFQATVVANARTGTLDEVLEMYPMRPQDARVLGRYVVGDATAEDATKAFEESLRDPSWMMQWFEKHHEKLNPFIEWIRNPAASMLSNLNEMAVQAASIRKNDVTFGSALADTLFSSSKWAAWQDKLLHSTAVRMSNELLGQDGSNLTAESIDKDCPGMSVGIRSLHSAWWTTTVERPRQAKLSDFPDALHAMYAPYVDIFRADSFMAPHIAKTAGRFGTRVVPKLTLLPSAIQAVLSIEERVA